MTRSFEPKYPMTPWNEKELEFMKRFALESGEMGYALTDGPQAVAWYDFYMARQPIKARILYNTLAAGSAYMVPAEFPHYYEIGWGPKENPRQKLLPNALSSKTLEERKQFVDRVLKGFRGTASGNG
jgi:hypothetical protein